MLFIVGLVFCAVLLLGLVGAPVYMWTVTPKVPIQCGITRITDCSYEVHGIVPWGLDISYGVYGTPAAAFNATEQFNCLELSRGEAQ